MCPLFPSDDGAEGQAGGPFPSTTSGLQPTRCPDRCRSLVSADNPRALWIRRWDCLGANGSKLILHQSAAATRLVDHPGSRGSRQKQSNPKAGTRPIPSPDGPRKSGPVLYRHRKSSPGCDRDHQPRSRGSTPKYRSVRQLPNLAVGAPQLGNCGPSASTEYHSCPSVSICRTGTMSNAYSAFMRGVPPYEACTSRRTGAAVVVGALLYGFRQGVHFDRNLAELRSFLERPYVTFVPVGPVTADRYSRVMTALKAKGRPIPINDVWIAAHAMTGADLVSADNLWIRRWDCLGANGSKLKSDRREACKFHDPSGPVYPSFPRPPSRGALHGCPTVGMGNCAVRQCIARWPMLRDILPAAVCVPPRLIAYVRTASSHHDPLPVQLRPGQRCQGLDHL